MVLSYPVILIRICYSHRPSDGGINNRYLSRKPLIRRDSGEACSFYGSYLNPKRLRLPSLLSYNSLDILGRHRLNQQYLVYVCFSFRPSLPCFPNRVYNSSGVSRASSSLLCPPRSCPSLSVPGLSRPMHDATVLLGRRLLRL